MKTYLNLEGRAPEDIHQELSYLFMAVKRLRKLQEGSFEYAAISYDLADRMNGFKKYFSKDVDSFVKDIGNIC